MKTKIDSIELRIVALDLVHPFQTSFGEERTRQTVLVKIASEGLEGYGEAPVAAVPGYSYETVGTAFHALRDFFAPRLAGLEVEGAEALPSLFFGLKGHPMARAGLEAALSDLRAKAAGTPLRTVYGGAAESIEVGVSLGIEPSVGDLVERVGVFVRKGYRRVKLKIKPGWDLEPVAAVRKEFPDLRLWADANQAYGRSGLEGLRPLDREGLELLEQPLHAHDLTGHAAWAKALETPICLDESVVSLEGLENALELQALEILNVKPARVGGNSVAILMEERCRKAGIPCWVGGLLETGIGRAHNVALASRPGFTLPGDLSASDRYFAKDLVDPPFALKPGGRLEVPSGPGLGKEVDKALLERLTLRRAVVRV